MANPGREAPLAGTGLARQYKPQKIAFRRPCADTSATKNHWVCLPMANSEPAPESDPQAGQPKRRYPQTEAPKYLDRKRLAAISDTAHSDIPQITRELAKVSQVCRHCALRPSVRTLTQRMAGRRASATLERLSPFWRYAAMKIIVSASSRNPACPWQVQLDQHVVSFRSEAEARAFVATLETRLQAPHPLMREAWPASAGSAARH